MISFKNRGIKSNFGDIAINNPPTNWGLRCLWCFLRCVDMNFQLRIWDFTLFRKCIYSLCCSNGLYWVGRGHPWSSYSKSLPSPYRQKSQCGLHQFITQRHPSIRVLFVYHSPSIQEPDTVSILFPQNFSKSPLFWASVDASPGLGL